MEPHHHQLAVAAQVPANKACVGYWSLNNMATTTYAVVKDGVVENMLVWDGVTSLSVPDSIVVEATADTIIGGTYDGSSFTYVTPAQPDKPAAEQATDTAAASAVTKLKALGLTDAEIAAIKGVT